MFSVAPSSLFTKHVAAQSVSNFEASILYSDAEAYIGYPIRSSNKKAVL